MAENNENVKDNKKIYNLKIDLLKMEYEKCVELFKDIYRSIWTIFSYSYAITAALLMFGNRIPNFTINLIITLAVFPLFFWWLGVFTPMNEYGEKRIDRLIEIEKELNQLAKFSGTQNLCCFKSFKSRKPRVSICKMWKTAAEDMNKKWKWAVIFRPSRWMRVKFAADFIGLILSTILFIYFIVFIFCIINWNFEFFYNNSN